MVETLERTGTGHRTALDDPGRWLRTTSLLDLEDPRLRLRAHALTQLCKSERDKALALYGFVKRLPFHKSLKMRLRTAREVIDAGRGDADDKSTVLVALLRASEIPARIRYIQLRGDILRGLTSAIASAARPVVEVWLNDTWNLTDTYIFDAAYMAAARQRLNDAKWDWGYGIHREGHLVWSGAGDAWLGGMPTDRDPMVMSDMGVFNDPMELRASPAWRALYPRIARSVQWNVLAPMIERVVRELRQEATASAPRPRRA